MFPYKYHQLDALTESTQRCLPWQDLSSLVLLVRHDDKDLPRQSSQTNIVSWSVLSDDNDLITALIVSLGLVITHLQFRSLHNF